MLRFAPDAGLFGPQSVTWRVHADPLLVLGGLRALLLQAAHPLAMAGVMAHSEFREDPWGRLWFARRDTSARSPTARPLTRTGRRPGARHAPDGRTASSR